ncbi:MAG: hypothetical protein ABIP48_30145 [Planctomycetota bacterium]
MTRLSMSGIHQRKKRNGLNRQFVALTSRRLTMTMLMSIALATCTAHGSQEDAEPPKLVRAPANWPIHLPEDSELLPLAEDDPCWKAIAGQIATLKENFARNKLLDVEMFGSPREIKGNAIAKLFPNHRFFVFMWNEKVKEPLPPNTSRPGGLLLAARAVIAIDKEGVVKRFRNYWSIELAGEFLAKNRVKIQNAEDARLVWDALCEIYRRERTGGIEKVSERVWRLGIEKDNRGRHYYDVRLNPDFSVKSMEYGWETGP